MGWSEAPNGARQAPAARLEHLVSVLRAVREVNQLIAQEREPLPLLRGACDRLLQARRYRAVWLALVDKRGTPSWATASGEEERLAKLLAHIGTGRLPPCGQIALTQAAPVSIPAGAAACRGCPLGAEPPGKASLVARITHADKVYGVLAVTAQAEAAHDQEDLSLLAELAQDLGHALHALELAREKAQLQARLTAIGAFGRELTLIHDQTEVAQQVVRAAQRILGFDDCGLFFLDEARGKLVLGAHTLGDPPGPREFPLGAGKGVMVRVARTGETSYVPDTRKDRDFIRGTRPNLSELCVPVKWQGKVLGVLNVESEKEDAFSPADRTTLELLADVTAIALENARLFQELAEKADQLGQANRRLRLLVELIGRTAAAESEREVLQGVVRGARRLLGVPAAALFTLTPDGKALSQQAVATTDEELESQLRQGLGRVGRAAIPLAEEGHWLVRVLREGQPNWYYRPRPEEKRQRRVYSLLERVLGADATAGIPLQAGRQQLGVLVFALPRGHRWSEEDKELLLVFARQAALALAKLRSLEELRSLKEFNERLIQSMTEGVALDDADGVIIYANPAFGELVGLPPEEIVGRHWTEFVPEEHRQRVRAALARRREGEVDRYRLELVRADGKRVPVLVSGGPRLEEGRFVGTQGVFTDITPLAEAEARLQRALDRAESLLRGAVAAAVRIIEKRDPYVADHSQRVARLACAIAQELGLAQERIEGLRMAAMLHDVGKVAVPAEILSKPGRLSEAEFKLVQAHPQVAAETLADIDFPWPVQEIILQHHERLDGSGYPRGLKAEDILLEARILAVADIVEAMAHHRPYRPALGIEAALREIERGKGTLYDPQVVDACLRLFRERGFTWD